MHFIARVHQSCQQQAQFQASQSSTIHYFTSEIHLRLYTPHFITFSFLLPLRGGLVPVWEEEEEGKQMRGKSFQPNPLSPKNGKEYQWDLEQRNYKLV